MGEVDYRPKEFTIQIDRLHIAIDDKNFDEAKKLLENLKFNYGTNDATIIEAEMLINMFSSE